MKMLVLGSLLSIFSIHASAPETVKIIGGEAFAPLMWNDIGRPAGMANEVAKAVFEKADYKVVAETGPWNCCQVIAENDGGSAGRGSVFYRHCRNVMLCKAPGCCSKRTDCSC